jgi:hypothetical protein
MCIVCQYNQVKDIDRALLAGVSPATLSQRCSFSKSDLQRHQEHLQQKMALASKRFHETLHQGLFLKLNTVMEMVLFVVRGAKIGGDFKLMLQASREFTRIIGLMHKLAVPLDPELLYCLMASPQWDLQDNLLPAAFQALADTRQSLKVNLFAPCPDPVPDLDIKTNQNSLPGTRPPELETPGIRLASDIPRIQPPETVRAASAK